MLEEDMQDILDKGLKRLEDEEELEEDTVKKENKWVNKGKEGTHGEFT